MNITSFDINQDFFDLFPELRISFPNLSSEQLWAIALLVHPKSAYKNINLSERKDILKNDFSSNIIWEEVEKEIELFKDLCLSKKQRYLIDWESKLDERQTFIASIPYNQETYEDLDKMMAATDKMWKTYLSCLKDVEDEEAMIIGGAQESLAEQGLL